MNEMEEITKLIAKGAAFEQLLNSPVFKEGMAEARFRLHTKIEETAEGDAELREHLYILLRTLMIISATLSSVTSEGIAAEQYVEQIEATEDDEL